MFVRDHVAVAVRPCFTACRIPQTRDARAVHHGTPIDADAEEHSAATCVFDADRVLLTLFQVDVPEVRIGGLPRPLLVVQLSRLEEANCFFGTAGDLVLSDLSRE